MRTRPMVPTLLTALLLVLAACTTDGGATAGASASAPASDGDGAVVTIVGFAFEPTELTIPVGTTVRFVNEDGAAHTVTNGSDGTANADAAFDEEVAAGESVEITFDETGDVSITCTIHPAMNMVVHVE